MSGKKNQNKTKQNAASVADFLEKVENEDRRQDCVTIMNMMGALTGEKPKMWGASIIGFGSYHYKYDSGREGDFMRIGFSPRKQNLTLYIMSGFSEYEALLAKLGKHKTGKSCLYIKKVADVDMDVLKEMCERSLVYMAERYPN